MIVFSTHLPLCHCATVTNTATPHSRVVSSSVVIKNLATQTGLNNFGQQWPPQATVDQPLSLPAFKERTSARSLPTPNEVKTFPQENGPTDSNIFQEEK